MVVEKAVTAPELLVVMLCVINCGVVVLSEALSLELTVAAVVLCIVTLRVVSLVALLVVCVEEEIKSPVLDVVSDVSVV